MTTFSFLVKTGAVDASAHVSASGTAAMAMAGAGMVFKLYLPRFYIQPQVPVIES